MSRYTCHVLSHKIQLHYYLSTILVLENILFHQKQYVRYSPSRQSLGGYWRHVYETRYLSSRTIIFHAQPSNSSPCDNNSLISIGDTAMKSRRKLLLAHLCACNMSAPPFLQVSWRLHYRYSANEITMICRISSGYRLIHLQPALPVLDLSRVCTRCVY